MAVGIEHKGEVWTDVLGWAPKEVTIGDDGFGEFDWYVFLWKCQNESCDEKDRLANISL